MGRVIFGSAQIVGHQYVGTSGYQIGLSVTSDSLPAWGTYTITGAVLEISAVRSDLQHEIIVYKNQNATGSEIGSGWNHSSPGYVQLSRSMNYSGMTSVWLVAQGGTAMQITSGAYVTVTIDYTVNASALTLSASSVEAGGSVTSTITPNSTAYTHRLVYSMGSASVTHELAAGVTSDTLTLSMEWLNQIPRALSGTATVTLYTLSGGSVIGQASKSLTITCPASVVPVIDTISAAPNGSVSIGSGLYVRTRDGVTAEMSGVTEAYGVIAATGISVGGYAGSGYNAAGTGALSLTSSPLSYAGVVTVSFWARDGRGRTTTRTLDITVADYSLPEITLLSGRRVDVSGADDPTGTLGKWALAWTASTPGGSYACAASLTCKQGSTLLAAYASPAADGWLTADGSNITLDMALDYQLELTLTDNYTTIRRTAVIPSAQMVLSTTPDFDGVAFGMAATRAGAAEVSKDWAFWCHAREIRDLIYPVGSIYLSVSATSPASIYGGTWEQITDRFLLAAGSSYGAGTSGGAASVTLTEEQLPKISGTLLSGNGNNGATAGGFGPLRSATGCLSVAQERQYTGPTTGTSTALSGNYAQLKLDIGGGQSVGILPPYLAVYVWQRIA